MKNNLPPFLHSKPQDKRQGSFNSTGEKNMILLLPIKSQSTSTRFYKLFTQLINMTFSPKKKHFYKKITKNENI